LITSHPGKFSITRNDDVDGLTVIRLPRPSQKRLLRRKFEPYMTHAPLSYGTLRLGSYDLAHAAYATDAMAAARWKAKTGKPAIFSYMGVPDFAGLVEFRFRLEILEAAMKGVDSVVSLSQYAADAFEYWLGYESPVIAPGVDLDVFAPRFTRSETPTIVCSAAAGELRKQVGLLVEAFKLVRHQVPEARLVLSAPRFYSEAHKAGVDIYAEGVEWTNLDSREALAKAYSCSSKRWRVVRPWSVTPTARSQRLFSPTRSVDCSMSQSHTCLPARCLRSLS
jgi:glycosyltransferase involved in cell wall biosynthesis